jgi:acid phosphatase
LKWLATHGITLSNYFAVTHPSLPNYVAATSGDYYGLNNDNHNILPANISSVVDILEDKSITWGEYQESMPYTGFTGDYPNPESKANMYVRKHKYVSFCILYLLEESVLIRSP